MVLFWVGIRDGVGLASGSPDPSEPVFHGLMVDGHEISGRIVAIGSDRITLVSMEYSQQEVALSRLVKLTRELGTPASAMEGSHAIFPEGDRLMRVVVGTATETTLDVYSHSLGKLVIPLDCFLGLVLTPPSEHDAFDHLWEQVRSEPRSTAVVWLANGDRMSGGFLGMDGRIIKLQMEGKPVDIDRAGVVALGFDPALASYPRPTSDFLEVTLTDGTRLGVGEAKIEKGYMLATTRFGQQIRFPLADLIRLVPRTPSVVYLTEREVAGQQYVSFIGPTRPFQVDRTVEGHQFRLGGHSYDRGLGTQSRTLLAYRLQPGDRRFQAMVGVDERAGPLGSVAFRVVTDGQTRFLSPSLTARDAPQAIDVDLSGTKYLILITEFGDRGDVRDLADWVEARIIR
jgi:hypothetical protein